MVRRCSALCCYVLCIACVGGWADTPLSVWAPALQGPEVTRLKLTPFFDHWGAELSLRFQLQVSLDFEQVLRRCQEPWPDIAMASLSHAAQLRDRCQYRVVAVTTQDIGVYARQGVGLQSLPAAPRVAIIRGAEATRVGLPHLQRLLPEVQLVVFDSFADMVRGLMADHFDIMLVSQIYIRATEVFSHWQLLQAYPRSIGGAVLLSPSVDKDLADKVAAAFVHDSAFNRALWVGSFGINPWQLPGQQSLMPARLSEP